MRKIALDIGDVRIGLATSDMLGIIASGYETYVRAKNNETADLEYIAKFCQEREADAIVVGLPFNMDGTEGDRVIKYRAFAEKLGTYTTAKIFFQDERLTTVQAERMLIEGGVRRDKRKQVIDKVAATIILQAFLDRH